MTTSFETAVNRVRGKLTPETMGKLASVIAFNMEDTGERFTLDASGPEERGWLDGAPSEHGLDAPFEVTISRDDFAKLIGGDLNPMAGVVTGRMRLKGDLKGALRLDKLLKD